MHVWRGSVCALVFIMVLSGQNVLKLAILVHDIYDSTTPCLDTDEDCPDDGHDFKDDSPPVDTEPGYDRYEPYPPYPEPALDVDYDLT